MQTQDAGCSRKNLNRASIIVGHRRCVEPLGFWVCIPRFPVKELNPGSEASLSKEQQAGRVAAGRQHQPSVPHRRGMCCRRGDRSWLPRAHEAHLRKRKEPVERNMAPERAGFFENAFGARTLVFV